MAAINIHTLLDRRELVVSESRELAEGEVWALNKLHTGKEVHNLDPIICANFPLFG